MVVDRNVGYIDFIAELREMEKKEIVVGLFDESNAKKALHNEFGTAEIPQRSFLRSAMAESEDEAVDICASMADLEDGANVAAKFLERRVKHKIKNGSFVDNAPSTIKRKGFNKPLIDSGKMLAAVKGMVRNKNE